MKLLGRLLAMIVPLLAAGCQLYRPEPLDSVEHEAQWRQRSNEADLRALANTITPKSPSASASGAADGIDLATGEVLALLYNPRLRAAWARATVQLTEADHAGRWDDPVLSGDVLRVVEHVEDRWVLGGTVGVRVPISGRLAVQKDGAQAAAHAEVLRYAELGWATRAEFRSTWVEWSAAQREAELLAQLVERIGGILTIVGRLEQAGALSRLEARLFRLEQAARTSDLHLAQGRERELRLAVLSLMGLRPECPLAFEPIMALAAPTLPADRFQALLERSPVLAAERAAYEVSEQELRLEIRRQFPDLELGPAFERDGNSDRWGVGFSLPLPLWNRNAPAIAAAHARRAAARAAFEMEHERLLGELHRWEVRHAAAFTARREIEQTLLPLAEAQLDDVRRRTELGELDALLTLESVVRSHEVRVRWLEASVDESLAASRLLELLGPPATSDPASIDDSGASSDTAPSSGGTPGANTPSEDSARTQSPAADPPQSPQKEGLHHD